MPNAPAWAPVIRQEGAVRAPGGDAPTACVDPRDVAAVAVRVLTEPGHEGRTCALTGPQALSPREQTRTPSEVLERPLRFEEFTFDQALEGWRRRLPEPGAQALAEAARRRGAGDAAHPEDSVTAVTGRAPRTFATRAADHAERFR